MSNYVNDMTNEEIWEMLQPKLLKNYIFPNNVSEAVGMAYRVGYLRAMKGRPFKIGEKKKKGGHWEPVDPKNLPKKGTRVRYSRPVCFEDEFYLIGWNVGDEGIVNYHGNYFGVKREGKNWDEVGMFGYYFDMWVEDDE